jgi:NitT/TauT family transport system ATP-binding protein
VNTSDITPFAVTLEGIQRHFGSKTVLEGCNLNLVSGELTALIGPSGCGKSTLLRLLAGLDTPDGGGIQRSPAASDLGFVFQEPALLPWRTVLGNVLLPLELARVPGSEREARALDPLRVVGLDAAGHLYPEALSGGMKMRVALARAVVTHPGLLLLDEPFAALDDITRDRLNAYLLELFTERAMTVVLVTHALREAAYLSDRICLMSREGGRIVLDVRVPFARPRSPELTLTPEFARFVATVASALRDTMAEDD